MKRSDPPREQQWALYRGDLGSYMKRWILRFAGRTLRIHNTRESDAGQDFHDHPFDFTSLILKGGYIEHRPECQCQVRRPVNFPTVRAMSYVPGQPCRFYGPGSIVRRKATDLHRLELVNGPAWTLVLTSKYKRRWGFQTPDGWVSYRDYPRSYYEESPYEPRLSRILDRSNGRDLVARRGIPLGNAPPSPLSGARTMSPEKYADTLERLATLIRRKPMTVAQIAAQLGCCKPIVYQRLRELVRRGRTITTQRASEPPRGARRPGPRAAVYSCS